MADIIQAGSAQLPYSADLTGDGVANEV